MATYKCGRCGNLSRLATWQLYVLLVPFLLVAFFLRETVPSFHSSGGFMVLSVGLSIVMLAVETIFMRLEPLEK